MCGLKHYLYCCLIFIGCLPLSLLAQDNNEDEADIRYLKEVVIGANLNTLGWGVTFRHGKRLTIHKKRIIEAELVGIKHPKEKRKRNNIFTGITCHNASPSPFVYGKQNSFYTLRAGLGRMNVLYQKAEENGVEVRFIYTGGASLGILKPYYLDIVYAANNRCYVKHEKYNPEVPLEENNFLNPNRIYGSSGFTYGLDEIKPHPGIYGKAGLNFEWASYNDLIKAVEVGAMLDVYYREAPIMTVIDNKQFFASLYIDVQMGWRW